MGLHADHAVRREFEEIMEGMWCDKAKDVALAICLAALEAVGIAPDGPRIAPKAEDL